VPVVMKE